jgi:uncharacterized membrane protein HdeD (DUF308 family)
MALGEDTPLLREEEERLETLETIARNWAWIGAFGVLNFIFGVLCLLYPVWASEAVGLLLACTVTFAGCFHFSISWAYPTDFRWQLLLLGAVQIFLGVLMFLHPKELLTFLTFMIALVFMSVGGFLISYARQNSRLAARGLNILSGILMIVFSIYVILGMPYTSWITVGILLGVNYINMGFTRIMVASFGLRLSRQETIAEEHVNASIPVWLA